MPVDVEDYRFEDVLQTLGPLPRAVPLEVARQEYRRWRKAGTRVAGRPLAEVLEALVGPLPLSQRNAVIRRLALAEFQARCLSRSCRTLGLDALPELVHCPD